MIGTLFKLALLLILLASPSGAEETVVAEAKDRVILAFRIKVSVSVAGQIKTMDIAPKVVVRNHQEAQITVDTPEKTSMSIKARPHLTAKGAVELTLTVTASLGGTDVDRQVRLVTLLGSPALIEFNDDDKKETLTIEVIPTRAP